MSFQPTFPARDAPVLHSHDEALDAARAIAALWSRTAAEIDRERRIPEPELRALEQSGLLAITVPRKHGGPGLPNTTLAEVFLTLARVDTALAQIPQNHFDFVDTLIEAEPRTQRLFYPLVLSGARFGNALAEPGRKSRQDLATSIVEDGEGWRINGRKYFSTGALTAPWVPVTALHADGRIRTAYLPRDAKGLTVEADWDAFGQRATFSGTTVIDNVYVPRSHVVDRSLGTPEILVAQFAGNQLIHAAIEAGSAEGAVSRIASLFGASSEKLELLAVKARAARALVLRAARLVDAALNAAKPDRNATIAAAVAVDEAKSLAYELGPEATGALAAFANARQFADGGLDRFWRNTRTHSMHDPVRWRQHYVGDFHLNGRLSADLVARLRIAV